MPKGKERLSEVMTRKVVVAHEDEPVDVVARRINKYEISGLPIVDNKNNVKGMITAEDISRLIYAKRVKMVVHYESMAEFFTEYCKQDGDS